MSKKMAVILGIWVGNIQVLAFMIANNYTGWLLSSVAGYVAMFAGYSIVKRMDADRLEEPKDENF